MHPSSVIYISYEGQAPRGHARLVVDGGTSVEKRARNADKIRYRIGRIDSGDKYARRMVSVGKGRKEKAIH